MKLIELCPMTAQDFIDWRTRLGLKQTDAAILLGVGLRSITYYETGGREIDWSKTVVCYCFEHWPELRAQIPDLLEEGQDLCD
jgi:DNA-binding XRE family transcriptional regulator